MTGAEAQATWSIRIHGSRMATILHGGAQKANRMYGCSADVVAEEDELSEWLSSTLVDGMMAKLILFTPTAKSRL